MNKKEITSDWSWSYNDSKTVPDITYTSAPSNSVVYKNGEVYTYKYIDLEELNRLHDVWFGQYYKELTPEQEFALLEKLVEENLRVKSVTESD